MLDELLMQARKKGTDKQYREWIQRQPSCISGRMDYTDSGMRCEAAHVRRAGESGIAFKAPYACVPLTHLEHHIQHTKGEKAVLTKHLLQPRLDDAKAWFDEQRVKYLKLWINS